MVRADESQDRTDDQQAEVEFSLTRPHMDSMKRLLRVAGEAAEKLRNVVDAKRGKLTQESVLDIFGRVQMDFDPNTGQIAPGFTRIIELKREEQRDSEARRKSVD
jgi:hypothetical protein